MSIVAEAERRGLRLQRTVGARLMERERSEVHPVSPFHGFFDGLIDLNPARQRHLESLEVEA